MSINLNQVLNEAQLLGINIVAAAGSPTGVAKFGTLYIKTDATLTTDRLWISTGTTWGYVTTSV